MKKYFLQKRITQLRQLEKGKNRDFIAIEEPLQIILEYFQDGEYIRDDLVITMRTPGKDRQLAVGFLLSEGIIKSVDAINFDGHIGHLEPGAKSRNRYLVSLNSNIRVILDQQKRHTVASSSCGICGKTQIKIIVKKHQPKNRKNKNLDFALVYQLLDRFNTAHEQYDQTGAMHSAAAFQEDTQLTNIAFDVGRHNALDKIIGQRAIDKTASVKNEILLLSGRVSYEMMQKAVSADFHSVIALGAPTSLAIELAEAMNMNLVGFAKKNQMNIYHEN